MLIKGGNINRNNYNRVEVGIKQPTDTRRIKKPHERTVPALGTQQKTELNRGGPRSLARCGSLCTKHIIHLIRSIVPLRV